MLVLVLGVDGFLGLLSFQLLFQFILSHHSLPLPIILPGRLESLERHACVVEWPTPEHIEPKLVSNRILEPR